MDNSPRTPDWELIEGYYEHTLSVAEREQVEHRLATDLAFRANAEAWQEADSALRLLAQQQSIRHTVRQELRQLYWKGRIQIGVGISVATCLIAGWILVQFS